MAKQQFNRRLSDETIAAINWWAKQDSTPARKVTDTEIVERAIAMYDEMRANGREIPTSSQIPSTFAGRGLEDVLEVQKRFNDPAAIPSVSVGVPRSTGFPCRCVHSGCRGLKFTGASKFANLCPECEESGHRGNQRECQECFNDTGPA